MVAVKVKPLSAVLFHVGVRSGIIYTISKVF